MSGQILNNMHKADDSVMMERCHIYQKERSNIYHFYMI